MKTTRANYIVVGLVVLAAIAGLIGAIVLLAGGTGPADRYYTVFDQVQGIERGTDVTYDGYQVGRVAAIEPQRQNGQTRYRVTLALTEDWPVAADSVAQITAPGLLSAYVVNVEGGESAERLTPGDQITAGSTSLFYAQLTEVSQDLTSLTQNQLVPLIETLATQVERLGGPLAEQAPEILANLRRLTAGLAEDAPAVASDVRAMTDRLNREVLDDGGAARLGRSVANLDRMAANAADTSQNLQAVAGDIDRLIAELQAAASAARATMEGTQSMVAENRDDIQTSIEELRFALETVAQDIESITYNLGGASRNMNEFTRRLRQNPSLLLRPSGGGDE